MGRESPCLGDCFQSISNSLAGYSLPVSHCRASGRSLLDILDKWQYKYYYIPMKESRRKPNVSIRIDKDALHEAKVAAVAAKKTLGDWLEEAIKEKIEREATKGRKP